MSYDLRVGAKLTEIAEHLKKRNQLLEEQNGLLREYIELVERK